MTKSRRVVVICKKLTILIAACTALLGLSSEAAEGDTIKWLADSKVDNNWHNPENWDLGRVPEDGDEVVLTKPSSSLYSQITTTMTNVVPTTGSLKKLTIQGQHTLSFKGWNSKLSAKEIELSAGAVYHAGISCAECTSSLTSRVWIVTDKLTVNSKTRIGANGFGPGLGPCWEGVESPSGPPAHGGLATDGNARICGSITDPELPGGGGESSGSNRAVGGGVIRIEATTIQVDGTISATGGRCPYNKAGAAGGSVYITCDTITGSGTVEANGGGNEGTTTGGCGGSGRIAVRYDAEKQSAVVCNVHFSAVGGYDGKSSNNDAGRFMIYSQCGTLYFTDDQFVSRSGIKLSGKIYYGPSVTRVTSIETPGDLEIVSCMPDLGGEDAHVTIGGNLTLRGSSARKHGLWLTGQNMPVSIGGNLTLTSAMLRIDSGSKLTVGGNVVHQDGKTATAAGELYVRAAPTNGLDRADCGMRVEVAGDWTLGKYGMITTVCDPTNGAVVAMSARNFDLSKTAILSADGTGWAANRGPGQAPGWMTGASYGGRGCGYAGGLDGTCYGNKRHPLQPGSGAGAGAGGGVIWLETSRRMDLNGSVTASGKVAGNWAGASSGGSVYLQCGSCLSGTNGTIKANGGDGGSLGGSGGGGRVAIRYRSRAKDISLTATANGGSYNGYKAEDGSVYWHQYGGLMISVR